MGTSTIYRTATAIATVTANLPASNGQLLVTTVDTHPLYGLTIGTPTPNQDHIIRAAAMPALQIGATGLAILAPTGVPNTPWTLTLVSDNTALIAMVNLDGTCEQASPVGLNFDQATTLLSTLLASRSASPVAARIVNNEPVPDEDLRGPASTVAQLTYAGVRYRIRYAHPGFRTGLNRHKPRY